MHAQKTNFTTLDGLTVYDLSPQASDLWAVAGPDGVDPQTIDPDSLPDGFRWVENSEWEALNNPKHSKNDKKPANATIFEFAHKGQGWIATLDGVDEETGVGRLTVRPDNYDDDPCAGQNFARSAFFAACEELELTPINEASHSGGHYASDVTPDIESSDDE